MKFGLCNALAHCLCLLILTGSFSTRVSAQTPLPQPEPTRSPSPPLSIQPLSIQADTLTQRMPDHLTGVAADKVVRWTLKDSILAALEKNPDIEIGRQSVRLAQFSILAAQGVYDPLASSTLNYNWQRTPNFSQFSGSAQDFLQNTSLTYNFGYLQAVERTGGSYQINFNNARNTSNTANLATYYNPALTLALTQPLQRNFAIDANRHLIQINKKKLDLSDAQFRQQVIQIIASVEQVYWDLSFAIRSEEIQRDALKLAETQLRNNQEQVKAGTLAQIDVITAATQVETVRQQVFQAMQAVAQAEDALKLLTVEGTTDELWISQIVPVESFELKPLTLSLPDALQLALDNRPEINQFAPQKEINDIDVKYFRDQTKPQVDLTASYGVVGVGGSAASFPDANGVLQPAKVSPVFIGGYGTALDSLAKNSFPVVRVGLNLALPLHNRTAQANLGSALETGRQLDTQLRKQQQTIQSDVRTAYHAVEAARLSYGAARSARAYAEQQLSGEQEKFSVGLSTTFLVLTRQNDLTQARGVEVQTLTNYNKAVADLQRAIAATLSANSIEIQSGKDNPLGSGRP
ncbi:MAG: TolC family protein [Acidobacteria bacterium]|nr:TolC family protein [Acidobacteriota bacterium]MBI3425906.1 TolC family protein [Acidobacteriota bacterium]